MADANPSVSPLETVASTVGDRTVEAFELLGNETRLAILLALWEAIDPGPPQSEPALSFSELRERVGIGHGQQFNYHLDKLVGEFVRKTESGYALTPSAEQFLRAVLAGTLTDQSSFEAEPIDEDCPHCGAPAVVDYDEGVLVRRCTRCEGIDVKQRLLIMDYPPAGLDGRTPGEVHRAGETLLHHRLLSMREGVCPFCAGTVTTSIHVCEDHDTRDGTPCERCERSFEIQSLFVCGVCKAYMHGPPLLLILTETAVGRFFYEHGVDLHSAESRQEVFDAIEVEATSEEPLAVRLRVELDGDRLDVTLDEEAHVLDVTESTT